MNRIDDTSVVSHDKRYIRFNQIKSNGCYLYFSPYFKTWYSFRQDHRLKDSPKSFNLTEEEILLLTLKYG